MLWDGVRIHTDHQNLAYILHPGGCVSSVFKVTLQCLENWKIAVHQYDYAEQAMAMRADVKRLFQHSFVQGSNSEIADIL